MKPVRRARVWWRLWRAGIDPELASAIAIQVVRGAPSPGAIAVLGACGLDQNGNRKPATRDL